MVWQLEFDPKAERVRGHPLSNILAGQHTYRIGQLRIIVRIQRLIVTVTVLKLERRDSAY